MPELIAPTADLHTAWWQAHAEWGPDRHENGFGLRDGDEVSTAAAFAAWLDRLAEHSDPARTIEVGRHRCTYRWIVEHDRVLGGIAVRDDGDDEYVSWAGHIGYGIRPSARRRGLGTWALARILDEAREQGRHRLLTVCAVDNTAFGKGLPPTPLLQTRCHSYGLSCGSHAAVRLELRRFQESATMGY